MNIMATILLNFRGCKRQIDQILLLMSQTLEVGRVSELPDIIQPGQITCLVEFDADQTLPLKPVSKQSKKSMPSQS